jgi:LmbE family N-acetylglucosaminyl deacetylase
MTSVIVRAACFAAPVPNFSVGAAATPLEKIPHLYYCDAVEGKDPLGHDVQPTFSIDVSKVMDDKARMLACHASQRNWLMKHHGMDHYLQAMRDWSARRGQAWGVSYAEGFRQHLGHSYPQDNLLLHVLGG